MCKIWKCQVDDPIFSKLNLAQWLWYYEMVKADKKESLDNSIQLIEYLAQFSEPERVGKVRKMREERDSHAFASDNEFDDQVKSKQFTDNPFLDAIKKIRKDKQDVETNNKSRVTGSRNLSGFTSIDKLLKD